ncbi:MAG: hypothetical protein NT154_16435 [Verrucomicrobia bacterium]|nr:hypothetical protein [Verrucomicrobiota bacterium]
MKTLLNKRGGQVRAGAAPAFLAAVPSGPRTNLNRWHRARPSAPAGGYLRPARRPAPLRIPIRLIADRLGG